MDLNETIGILMLIMGLIGLAVVILNKQHGFRGSEVYWTLLATSGMVIFFSMLFLLDML